MYSNDICFFPLGERHFVSQLVTSLFFRSVLLFIFLTPLFSQNLIIDKDNKVLINNKKQGYFARKILSFNGQPLILTYHQGIKYFDKSKMIDIPVPINPVFNRPRQIESFCSDDKGEYYFSTRNRIYRGNFISFTPLTTAGLLGGTRPDALIFFAGHLYLASTYNGIYRFDGIKWNHLSQGLHKEKYSWNAWFYEHISGFFIENNKLYCHTLEKGQVYKLEGSKWIKENTRVLATYNHSHVKKVSFINPTTEKNRFEYKNNKLNQFIGLKHYYPYKKFYPISQKNHRCLFINLDFITYKDMDNVVEIIRRGFADGVIVNFKDDTGNLIYGSKIKQAIEAKASFRHHKFNIFFSKLRKVNAYVVARLVAFKDYRMYTYKKNKYSLKNKQNGEPWKINKIEYWVDPFSTDIQNYLVSIFQELQDRREEFGLDEIQFDYIRFPSDSQLKTEVRFDFKKKDWERYDVLESLLSKISKKAEIPFSLDIFGYNGIYKMGNIIGQDIETISKYAPIICPMYYTSHFGSIYLQTDKSNDRVYNILKMGTERAIYYAYPGTKIAPFLQAFNYGIKIYDSEYIYQQIKGVKDGGSKSYNFWSPTSKYEKLLSFMIEIGNK